MSLTPRKPGVAQKEPSAELSIQCVDMALHRCTVYTPALLRPDSLAQAFYDRIGTADGAAVISGLAILLSFGVWFSTRELQSRTASK